MKKPISLLSAAIQTLLGDYMRWQLQVNKIAAYIYGESDCNESVVRAARQALLQRSKAWLYWTLLLSVAVASYYACGSVLHFQNKSLPTANSNAHQIEFAAEPGQSRFDSRQVADRKYLDPNGELAESYLTVPSEYTLSVSACLHLMRMYGPQAIVRLKDGTKFKLITLVTNAEIGATAFGGTPPIVKTPYGVRYPTDAPGVGETGDESHRDQSLATLGELKLPLNTTLVIGQQSFTVQGVLRDSLANFHLKQAELEWSTLAYTEYLAPVSREWTNRFGESFSFNDLALELLSRPLEKQSCGGLHCLAALSSLFNADTQYRILAPQVRSDIKSKLSEYLAKAIQDQREDGSWHPGWAISRTQSDFGYISYRNQDFARDEYVHATGHACEWLLGLDDEFAVPEDVLSQASVWLAEKVSKSRTPDRWNSFCPWSHAVLLSSPEQQFTKP